ncbi:zinc-dependent alcohol dehydrogenase family protein [Peristeroidobacter soli]|uniref:zinc-dependent alcohol dehydrogenase family protein n=1 Tax=Peristeroidobacter soli TaxID=2497877 RepID=UPI00101CFBBC|nr:zinc-dependent alcohol dehydrogenase family protein [Peristeroidobacter soli]
MPAEHSLCLRLHGPGQPLVLEQRPVPVPGPGQVLLKVGACGVCRTDLHLIDGELPDPKLPIVPGHEIVGTVVTGGAGTHYPSGTRLGVPWLGYTCGICEFCLSGQENLCDRAAFTGYQLDGGYAEHVVADARYCFELPASLDDAHAAPLLCAGLIGYRTWRMAWNAKRLGIYGFGAAAHLIAQVATHKGQEVYAFTRAGDVIAQQFALQLGARWAGASEEQPPVLLDAALIFAPVGQLVPLALRAVRKGGSVICGGIHMSDIPSLPYSLIWGERCIRSVANLTRRDGTEFLALAGEIGIQPSIETLPLSRANEALERVRAGALSGAAVLIPE